MPVASVTIENTTFLRMTQSELALFRSAHGIETFWNYRDVARSRVWHVLELLSRLTGLATMQPSPSVKVDSEYAKLLPNEYMQRHHILPLLTEEGERVMGVTTPFLGTIPSEIQNLLGQDIPFRLLPLSFFNQLLESGLQEKTGLDTVLSDLDGKEDWSDGDSEEELKDQAQAAPIIQLVNRLFTEAAARGASDIHIDPGENSLDFRYRMDGILQPMSTAPRRFQAAIISRIKIMANLDIAERRIPQDGRITLKLEHRSFDIRVATIPTVFGEGAVMRLLDRTGIRVNLEEIGFQPEPLQIWKKTITRSHGIVLKRDNKEQQERAYGPLCL